MFHTSDLEPYASPGLSECERRNCMPRLDCPSVSAPKVQALRAMGSTDWEAVRRRPVPAGFIAYTAAGVPEPENVQPFPDAGL